MQWKRTVVRILGTSLTLLCSRCALLTVILAACAEGCALDTRTIRARDGGKTDVGVSEEVDAPAVDATADAGVVCVSDAPAPIAELGTVQGDALQTCLNKSATLSAANPAPGEGTGVLSVTRDARLGPYTFVPTARDGGRTLVTVTMVGEGSGYANRLGWFNSSANPAQLEARNEIFACRDLAAECNCPCNLGPRRVVPPESSCTHWVNPNIAELDFDCLRANGRWDGGAIGFYIQTPESMSGGATYNCASAFSREHRVYASDRNLTGDWSPRVVVFPSRAFADAFYLGWEDLFGDTDHDHEDVLVRVQGVLPGCAPSCLEGERCELCRSSTTACGGPTPVCISGPLEPVGQVCPGGTCDATGNCRQANDRCTAARTLYPWDQTLLADTSTAARDLTLPCASTALGPDVFYRFNVYAPGSEIIYADTFGATFDTALSFLTDCSGTPWTSSLPGTIACNDDATTVGCAATSASVVVGVFAPGSYILAVGGRFSGRVPIHFQRLPVGNGRLALLAPGTATLSGATVGAGLLQPLCPLAITGTAPEDTWWWRTCPADPGGTLTASTCGGAAWDTVLSTRHGLGGRACDNDACGLQSMLTGEVPAGPGIHALYLDGVAGALGPYTLTVTRP